MPMTRGNPGIGCLRSASNKPLGLQFAFQRLEARLQIAGAGAFGLLHDDLQLAARLIDARLGEHAHLRPVLQRIAAPGRLRAPNIAHEICAPASLSEKYQCPLPCFLRLETSPSTHTSPTCTSNRFFIRRNSCVTLNALSPAGFAGENKSTPHADSPRGFSERKNPPQRWGALDESAGRRTANDSSKPGPCGISWARHGPPLTAASSRPRYLLRPHRGRATFAASSRPRYLLRPHRGRATFAASSRPRHLCGLRRGFPAPGRALPRRLP